jgi:hypothetical protein
MQIRDAKDFWSGVMFAAFGIFFMVFARQYDMGTAARMGPAFFPTMLGGLLLGLGVLVALKGLTAKTAGRLDRFHFKPLLLVLGAVVAFGLLLRPAGLLVSLTALVVISSLGSDEFDSAMFAAHSRPRDTGADRLHLRPQHDRAGAADVPARLRFTWN